MGDCTTTAPATTTASCAQLPRLDWYQTDSCVFINILLKGLKPEDVVVDIDINQVRYDIRLADCSHVKRCITLCHSIQPSECCWRVYPSKLEIRLLKAEAIRWESLEKCGRPPTTTTQEAPCYPSSNPSHKNWDLLVQDIKAEEASEQLEGDAALNQLFQKIYADGSDEVRKAMNKSFMESGGTVLSTNWKEVSEKKIEVNPPSGMEFRTWEK